VGGVAGALTGGRRIRAEDGGAEMGASTVAAGSALPIAAHVAGVPMPTFGLGGRSAGERSERAAEQAGERASSRSGLTEAAGQPIKRLRVHARGLLLPG
jgi:hypothetical protein